MTDKLPMVIAQRAFAIPVREPADEGELGTKKRVTKRKSLPRPSPWSVVFDTETTTDHAQRLRIGVYQVRNGDGLAKAGLFYEPDAISDTELTTLRRYAQKNNLDLQTKEEFIREVVYRYGYDRGGQIVGFNLPFDLSRLAISISTSHGRDMRGGFTMKLQPEPWHPPVLVKHLSSRAAFMRFAAPPRAPDGKGMRNKGFKTEAKRGYFQDVKTLAAALLGRSHSLASLSDTLKVHHPKRETDDHGSRLTAKYIDYAVNDVQATWECYVELRSLYDQHALTSTPPHRIYSEASLGKAYLNQMGHSAWRKLQPDFPPEILGIIMATFFGGRAEVRIRREITRVLYCDFRSMYPTVSALMGLWNFIIAESVAWEEATEKTKELLEQIDLTALQDPSTWPSLHVLVLVHPDDDVLPVRGRYDKSRTIGLNHVTSEIGLWYTLADCIASKILTGRVPRILRAIRFVPQGVQEGLKAIAIGGNEQFVIDPAKDDLFKRVIELRGEIQAQERVARSEGPDTETEQLHSYQQMLKLLANSTGYGIYAELNVQSYDDARRVTCYGGGGEPFEVFTRSVEEPGTHFHPLVATLITGAARLMLAIVERLASDQGIGWAFCDTDSMALARPQGMDDEEFLCRAKLITDWFDQLSPYDDDVPLFKIEDENFRLKDGQPVKGEHEPLYALAISAKRYVLFNLDEDGRLIIRKALAHGLGHLLPPYKEADAPRDIPAPATSLRGMGIDRWHYDLWYLIIEATLAGHPDEVDLSRLPNIDRPAVSRFGASTPKLLAWFKRFNSALPEPLRMRAFNFLLSLQVSKATFLAAIAEGLETAASFVKFGMPAVAAPYHADPSKAALDCFDRRTGEPFPIEFLATYREALSQYHLHDEAKFENGSGTDRGLTKRRHIQVIGVEYIGKEADRWEERYYLGDIPEAQIEYGLSPEGKKHLLRALKRLAGKIGYSEVARRSGLSRQQVSNVLNGKVAARVRTLDQLVRSSTYLPQKT